MPIPVLVPDASVLLKWALQSSEEGRDLALALKDAWLGGRCRLAVPSLWIYEVGNILGLKQPDRSGVLLQAMVDLELDQTGPTDYLDQIFRLMSDYKVTFYDAAYHGLAVFLHGTLITADAKYVRKTSRAGHVIRLDRWHTNPEHLR